MKEKFQKDQNDRYSKICSACGKILKAHDHSFFSINTGGVLCTSCTAQSLPESERAYVYELTKNLDKLRYMVFPEDFLREKCILQPIGMLVELWKNCMVHTTLTSLTHGIHGGTFTIEWNHDLKKGITHFDVYARNFNEGIKYPNIGWSGLRDFEHIKFVQRSDKKLPKDIPALLLNDVLNEVTGYAMFARSVAEVLIVATHAGIVHECHRSVIALIIKFALSGILKENNGSWKRFEEIWDEERLGAIVDEVEAAMVSDILRLQRFVRAAEIFVLALEDWF